MSVVIIGGNERMETQYKSICKDFGCQAKVFTKMPANLKHQIGSPDLVVVFVGTVSHKLAVCAFQEAKRKRARLARCHTSSSCALRELLREQVGKGDTG